MRGCAPTRTWNFLYTGVSLSAMYIAASHASSVSTWNFTMAKEPAPAPLGRHVTKKTDDRVNRGPSVEMTGSCQARRALRSGRYCHATLPNPAPISRWGGVRGQRLCDCVSPSEVFAFLHRVTKPDGLTPIILGLLDESYVSVPLFVRTYSRKSAKMRRFLRRGKACSITFQTPRAGGTRRLPTPPTPVRVVG